MCVFWPFSSLFLGQFLKFIHTLIAKIRLYINLVITVLPPTGHTRHTSARWSQRVLLSYLLYWEIGSQSSYRVHSYLLAVRPFTIAYQPLPCYSSFVIYIHSVILFVLIHRSLPFLLPIHNRKEHYFSKSINNRLTISQRSGTLTSLPPYSRCVLSFCQTL